MDLNKVNKLIEAAEKTIYENGKYNKDDDLLVGVDLGTAYIILMVLDSEKNPVACELEYAEVVRDGLVVDYIGALNIVTRLKEKLEVRLGVELKKAAIAIPPGVSEGDTKSHKYIVEGAGFEVTNILDEPTAANSVLNIDNGAIVDIGGGTTGISIIENGRVVYVVDEPTGGTHLSLVIAGNYGISFLEAEKKKTDSKLQGELLGVVTPVIQKMATIARTSVRGYNVEKLYLVGGSVCFNQFDQVFEKEAGIESLKPKNPFLVTPLGIAMNCH